MRSPRRLTRWGSTLLRQLAAVLPALQHQRQHQQLRCAQAALPAAADGLQAASSGLEREFLATGELLQELHREGTLFVQDAEQLICLAVGQSHGKELIVTSSKILASPLIFLEACLNESERLLARLQADHESIAGLLRAEANLRSTMAPLKFMQTLFKVESAPLGPEAQVMFSALTQEIERLHTQVCELFDTKFRELEKVQVILDEAGHKLVAQTTALRQFVTREKVQIQASLEKLAGELNANQQRDSRIRNLSHNIADEIQSIIMGLQFQDIINQKLEHTRTAVSQIMARAEPGNQARHFLEQSCRLEAGQLQSVRQDLAQAEHTVRTGVQKIQAHLSKADTDCLSLSEFEHITTSADGMVQVLLGLLDSVRHQVVDMTSRTEAIHRQLLPIHSMASGMTVVVRDLSHRIHLIGLNAQVQAAQFRHGGGLEVLSARTSEISQETNRISDDIATHLDQVSSGLASSVQSFDQLHTQALLEQDELTQQGGQAEASLHQLRDEALTLLQTIGSRLQLIHSKAGETLDTIQYTATADDTLATLQTRLEALAVAAASQSTSNPPAAANLVDGFRQDYTMASERQVFDKVMQTPEQLPSAATAAPPAGTAMEFFEPMETPPAPHEPVSEKPATAPAKGSELGDNIELF